MFGSGRSVLEELFLPTVKYRRLQAQFFTQIRNCHLVQKVSPQNRNLLFSSVVLALFSSYVRSAILTDERFLHFQLRRDRAHTERMRQHS